MLRALTARQVREIERSTVATSGESLYQLMVRAGAALAARVTGLADGGPIGVIVGSGNNGGDGWTAARHLLAAGSKVRVASLVEPSSLSGEAALAATAAIDAGVEWRAGSASELAPWFGSPTVVIDAILGVGARLPLSPEIASWCDAINAMSSVVVSADVPTGVHSDSGAVDVQDVVRADVTVTFLAPKRGLVIYPGAAYAGEVVVESLGAVFDPALANGTPEIWEPSDYAAILPVAPADAHKNDRGRVLVIAGSGRFPGAAILAARGAMRGGAGYVTLAVPEPVVAVAQAHLLAAPVVGLPASRSKAFTSAAADAALELAADYDAVVLGPGMTLADGAAATARMLVASLTKPLVIDADGLNALVDARGLLEARHAPTVLTPHPGELGRLLGTTAQVIQSDRLSWAAKIASPEHAVVLKGAGTVVSGAGRQVIVTAGTPALATAGTGDILAGLVGTLLAKGLDPLQAGALGAYLHGRAGEAAAQHLTPVCVTAEDVPDHIPDAVAELLGDW